MHLPVGVYEYVALLVPSHELAAVSEVKPLTRIPVLMEGRLTSCISFPVQDSEFS